jgi:hypothetical protein
VLALAKDVREEAREAVVDGLTVTLDCLGVGREVAEQRPLCLLQRVARPASAGRPLVAGLVAPVRLLAEAGVERDALVEADRALVGRERVVQRCRGLARALGVGVEFVDTVGEFVVGCLPGVHVSEDAREVPAMSFGDVGAWSLR